MLPLTLKHFSLPHLFSFHQQDFKAHFVSSATVPPFLPLPPLPFTPSNQVPQLEVKSLAMPPPCFWPCLLLSFPSLPSSFLQHLPRQPASFPLFYLLLTRAFRKWSSPSQAKCTINDTAITVWQYCWNDQKLCWKYRLVFLRYSRSLGRLIIQTNPQQKRNLCSI